MTFYSADPQASTPAPSHAAPLTFWPIVSPEYVADGQLSDAEFRLGCAIQAAGHWAKDVPGVVIWEGATADLLTLLPSTWSLRKVQRNLCNLRQPTDNGHRYLYAASTPGKAQQCFRPPYPCSFAQRADYLPAVERAKRKQAAAELERSSLAGHLAAQADAAASAPQPPATSRARSSTRSSGAPRDLAPIPPAERARIAQREADRAAELARCPQSEPGRRAVAAVAAQLPESSGAVSASDLRKVVIGSTDQAAELVIYVRGAFQARTLAASLADEFKRVAGKAVRFQAWAGLLLLLALPLLSGTTQHSRPEAPAVVVEVEECGEESRVEPGHDRQLTEQPADQRGGLDMVALPPGDRRAAHAEQVSQPVLWQPEGMPQVADLLAAGGFDRLGFGFLDLDRLQLHDLDLRTGSRFRPGPSARFRPGPVPRSEAHRFIPWERSTRTSRSAASDS